MLLCKSWREKHIASYFSNNFMLVSDFGYNCHFSIKLSEFLHVFYRCLSSSTKCFFFKYWMRYELIPYFFCSKAVNEQKKFERFFVRSKKYVYISFVRLFEKLNFVRSFVCSNFRLFVRFSIRSKIICINFSLLYKIRFICSLATKGNTSN